MLLTLPLLSTVRQVSQTTHANLRAHSFESPYGETP